MRLSVCEWIFVPVAHAPGDSSARKVLEMEWIQRLGALNPPKVHRLLRHFHAKRTFPSIRLFGCRQSLCRLRDKTPGCSQRRHENKAAQEAWKLGLPKIVAALAGHCFPGCGPSSVAAWRLSRAAWVYVVQRAVNHEAGWRRARALRMLRRIARVRKALPSPIAVISCDVPRVGSQRAQSLVTNAVRDLVASWRNAGHWLPILRHAKVPFKWASTPLLGDVLRCHDFFEHFSLQGPPCICDEFLFQDPTWPTVTFGGKAHIAASQAEVPWPCHLEKFRTLPANLRLPPKRQQICMAVRNMMRRLRDRCKLVDEACWVESCVATLAGALEDLAVRHSHCFPVSWMDVALARDFLAPFFSQIFDHNLSRLGVLCPFLVHAHACAALDLGGASVLAPWPWRKQISRPSLDCVLRLVLMACWLLRLSLTHLVHPYITLLTSVSCSLGRLGIPAPRKWLSSNDGIGIGKDLSHVTSVEDPGTQ